MSPTQKRKVFLATVLLAVAVLSLAVVTYAKVAVGSAASFQGAVTYSLDNAQTGTWNATLAPNAPSAPWYSRLEINSAGYKGDVTVTWKLQQQDGFFSWTDVPGAEVSTSFTLSGNVQIVYATSNGAYSISNYNWGQNVTTAGTYRVVATVTA